MPGGAITTEEWSYGDQWRSIASSPTGKLVYDEGFSTSSGYTLVSYLARTWARQRDLAASPARAAWAAWVAPLHRYRVRAAKVGSCSPCQATA